MKTLRELILTEPEEAMKIFTAVAKKEKIQYYHSDSKINWFDSPSGPLMIFESIYRIAPQPSTVDWSQVGEDIVAFATNLDGLSWAYSKIPEHFFGPDSQDNSNYSHKRWIVYAMSYKASLWPSFKPGNMPWQESLIIRPGKEQS